MKKIKTEHLVLGGVAVAGYLWWRSQQQPKQQAGGWWGRITGGLDFKALNAAAAAEKAARASIYDEQASQAEFDNARASIYDEQASQAEFDKSRTSVAGYYGSLGAYGDGGSLGGCRGSLGCGKYGSLG